jgi:hypothetical protein
MQAEDGSVDIAVKDRASASSDDDRNQHRSTADSSGDVGQDGKGTRRDRDYGELPSSSEPPVV